MVGPDAPLGFSLLHDVHDLLGSQKVVDLYLQQGIRCVNASAFIMLTAPLVQYRVSGVHQQSDGEIVVPNRMFAKISRAEVARRFMEPPPPQLVDQLLREGRITEREAELARLIPMADDITAEGDSGGHTDKQVLSALLPTMRALRDEIVAQHQYARPIRVGAAGGLGTPESVAAAFLLGADYVLTGSINQACVEAGTSRLVRQMLAEANSSDVAMAADAGSFELSRRFAAACAAGGVYLHPHHNWFVSTALGEADVARVLEVSEEAFAEVARGLERGDGSPERTSGGS